MMKEWKNNPESDEETNTDEETEQSAVYSPSANTAKQVGGMAATCTGSGTFTHGTFCCSSIISL
jgi:hypothetical protein